MDIVRCYYRTHKKAPLGEARFETQSRFCPRQLSSFRNSRSLKITYTPQCTLPQDYTRIVLEFSSGGMFSSTQVYSVEQIKIE